MGVYFSTADTQSDIKDMNKTPVIVASQPALQVGGSMFAGVNSVIAVLFLSKLLLQSMSPRGHPILPSSQPSSHSFVPGLSLHSLTQVLWPSSQY